MARSKLYQAEFAAGADVLANHVTRVTDGSELEALEETGSVLATRTGYGTTLTFCASVQHKTYYNLRKMSNSQDKHRPRET